MLQATVVFKLNIDIINLKKLYLRAVIRYQNGICLEAV